MAIEIEIVKGDITKMKVEAIANPENTRLTMGGGLAYVIRKEGGDKIWEEAQKFVPVRIGNAVVTGAGKLPCKFVIHAPTMKRPAQRISKENTRLAMQGILECAEKNGISEIAVPGLGTGVGCVPYKYAARVMVDTIRNFKASTIKKIILVGFDDGLYKAFSEAL